jgi:hypothetical protein
VAAEGIITVGIRIIGIGIKRVIWVRIEMMPAIDGRVGTSHAMLFQGKIFPPGKISGITDRIRFGSGQKHSGVYPKNQRLQSGRGGLATG